MKNFLLILLVIFSNNAFSQEIDSHEQFLTSVKEYKRVIQYNSTVQDYLEAIDELYPAYNKILNMDELPSASIQKALIKDYRDKYSYLFYDKDSGKNNLIVGLKTKEDYKTYLSLLTGYLELKTTLFIDDLIVENNRIYDEYVRKNLKRLNIKKLEFDKMSDNDKETLLKIFIK